MKPDPRGCSGAAALAVIGERYTLAILRELIFGVSRFDAIARNTGAPRDVLSTRLRHLERHGLITRERYCERPPRYEYRPTAAAADLAEVMIGIMTWGARWLPAEPSVRLVHRCGQDLQWFGGCRCCGEQVSLADLELHFERPGWSREGPIPQDASADAG